MIENGNISSVGSGQTNRVQPMEQNKYKMASVENNETEVKHDKATLSSAAQVLSKSLTALNDVDDVRQEKVTAIKKEIESGTYEVQYKNIASKIEGILQQLSE